MENSRKKQFYVFTCLILATLINGSLAHDSPHTQRKAYVVYMGDAPQTKTPAIDHHHTMLSSVIGDEGIAGESRIHSYGKSFNGFAAYLLPHEAQKLQEHKKVVSIFPNTKRKLHTTRSWDFIGMPLTVSRNTPEESDVIVGIFDTGLYIEAPSFSDEGFGPPPAKWKGVCQTGSDFIACNNKVIGARAYNMDNSDPKTKITPADQEGHGTHTSSTVAGVAIKGASLYGLGEGTARGGVPSARIAVYKVCNDGCADIDILAAFDDAIDDGVDVISLSIGGPASDYFMDGIAIGAFHAMKKGILTSSSAGNGGPSLYSAENLAPWILTVAATGMDRQFRTRVGFGNGMKSSGISINTFSPRKRLYPLTSGAKAVNQTADVVAARMCDPGALDEKKVKGKIVLCEEGMDQDSTIKDLGGVGTLISTNEIIDTGFTFLIPATYVSDEDAVSIETYINTSKRSRAIIYKSKEFKVAAPFVASFSSRGPDTVSGAILKPDLAAPGVDILAAYSTLTSVTGSLEDNRIAAFNIISGTSMACPHASAAAVYVKSFHPDWSPAMIKSALMTTATEVKIKDEYEELASGTGQIAPVKAVDPGLVYDMSEIDYIRFLCKQGYRGTSLRLITDEYTNCSSIPKFGGHDDLNYPSIYLSMKDSETPISALFQRSLTSVSPGKSLYKATVKSPKGLQVSVIPDALVFDNVKEKKAFKVVLKGPPMNGTTVLSATLEWSDSQHSVRSPILVLVPPPVPVIIF